MSAEIATLSEFTIAVVAGVRFLPGMLPVVVPQIATLLENPFAVANSALKVQLCNFCSRVEHSDGVVPLPRHIFNCFRVEHAYMSRAVTSIGDYAHIN